MQKLLTIGCFICCFNFHSRAQSPPVIDGCVDDWPAFAVVPNCESISYRLMADTAFLYLGIITTNRSIIENVFLYGMDLHFSENRFTAKKHIAYPMGISRIVQGAQMPSDKNRLRNILLNLRFNLSVKGLPGRSFVVDTRRVSGIAAKYNLVKGNLLVVEMKIPLAYLVKDQKRWRKIRLKAHVGQPANVTARKIFGSWRYFDEEDTVESAKCVFKAKVVAR